MFNSRFLSNSQKFILASNFKNYLNDSIKKYTYHSSNNAAHQTNKTPVSKDTSNVPNDKVSNEHKNKRDINNIHKVNTKIASVSPL